MNDPDDRTQRLFSYGTLQLEAVQLDTFGRRLAGREDRLPGFRLIPLPIDDARVVEISGKSVHTMATWTGHDADSVAGMVFEISGEELRRADGYEVPAVRRVSIVLASGVRAWTYIDTRSASPDPDDDDA